MNNQIARQTKDFKYSKNINGKLALGYGSKYQLLRMLGWHREDFTNKVKNAISYEWQSKNLVMSKMG